METLSIPSGLKHTSILCPFLLIHDSENFVCTECAYQIPEGCSGEAVYSKSDNEKRRRPNSDLTYFTSPLHHNPHPSKRLIFTLINTN